MKIGGFIHFAEIGWEYGIQQWLSYPYHWSLYSNVSFLSLAVVQQCFTLITGLHKTMLYPYLAVAYVLQCHIFITVDPSISLWTHPSFVGLALTWTSDPEERLVLFTDHLHHCHNHIFIYALVSHHVSISATERQIIITFSHY